MADRFTPWTGSPPAGWALPATTQQPTDTSAPSSPRFTPWSGSGSLPSTGQSPSGGSGGFDPTGALKGLFSAGGQLSSLGGALGALPADIASGAGQAFGGLGGLLSLVSGIRGGNPVGAALGGVQAGSEASSLLGGPSLSSFLGGLLPASEAGAGAAAAALPAGASGLIGLGLAPMAISLSNWLMGQGPPNGKAAETQGIRSNFAQAWPGLSGANTTGARFQAVPSMSPADQISQLQGIGQEGGYQLAQIPAVSQYTSTQGGRHGAQSGEMLGSFMGGTPGTPALDVSGIEKQTPQLYMNALLNSLVSNAGLAQRGVPFPTDTTGTTYRNPMQELGPGGVLYQLAQQAGVDPNQFLSQPHDVWNMDTGTTDRPMGPAAYQLTPEQTAGLYDPNQMLPTLQSVFGGLNPNFAQSPLGQRLAQLAPLLAPVTG